MALTLEQYADQLAERPDLNWPEPPEIDPPKAKPHLKSLPGIRAVTWNVYGTLLVIPSGELYFEHPNKFIMDVALDKTIQEYKMWKAMTRKPGAPSEYMRVIYQNAMADLKLKPAPTGEKHGAIASEHIWEAIVKKLATNEYTFNLSVYGSIDVYSQKIAYFFHASLQGTGLILAQRRRFRPSRTAGSGKASSRMASVSRRCSCSADCENRNQSLISRM
jgi:hypothetical protein